MESVNLSDDTMEAANPCTVTVEASVKYRSIVISKDSCEETPEPPCHIDSDMIIDGHLDLSAKGYRCLPPQICNGLGASITELYLDYNNIQSLPDDIGFQTVKLQVLSLNGNNLTQLPDSFGCLQCLRELFLNENDLLCLPRSISKLGCLEVLKVTANKLRHFPDNLGGLSKLKDLSADENELESMPSTLGLLGDLETLDMCDNKLSSVPDGIGRLVSLKTLNLSNNQLQQIPQKLGDLQRLEAVDLSGNMIESLPSHFQSSETLKKLYADRNRIASLPEWISELENATEISLNDNKFYKKPLTEKFGNMCQNLRTLNIGGNFISCLPESFGQLKNLENLHLGSMIGELERRAFQNGNWIPQLPDSFCELMNLREVHLDENLLSELPKNFGNLKNLEFLDLGQNMLHELPESFGELTSLKVCLLSKNQLQILPSSFGQLPSLEELRLDNNLLEELPESFNLLTELKSLDLFNNKLTEIPSSLGYFTKLVRLDLSENQFNIPWYEVPQITTQSFYPPRDPSFKNNWRGRPRQDLSMLDDEVIKIDNPGEIDFEPPPKDLGFSEDTLRIAAERNISLWKSHTGPTKREKFIHKNVSRSKQHRPQSDDEDHPNDEEKDFSDSFDEDDDYEPPIFQPENAPHSDRINTQSEVKKEPFIIQSEENWEEEMEEVDPTYMQYDYNYFNNIYQHPPPKTLAEAGYEVDEHLFLPYDIHCQPLVKQKEAFVSEDGQFDDVDSDS